MSNDTDEEAETVYTGTTNEEQGGSIETISKAEGRANIRQIIDIMLLSGVDGEEIENMLRHLADGVEYYEEDIQRYSQRE